MQAWLASSLLRFYPASQPQKRDVLELDAARGEQISFQAAFRTGDEHLTVQASVESDFNVIVRRVGYVPMPHINTEPPLEAEGESHIPGYVPDPLFPETVVLAGPRETNAFWFTFRIPKDSNPGKHPITVNLWSEGRETVTLQAVVNVHEGIISERQNFSVIHWFYADALCDWYRVEPFEEAFWPIVRQYMADIAAHNQDSMYVPIFTPPTDGVKRPTQLLGVRRDGEKYTFDWNLVRRWLSEARQQGLSRFEWTHLFTQWGAANAIRIYEGQGGSDKLLWPADTGAASTTYRNFLSQFLPEFKRFLEEENILDRSFFHLSDEPHGEAHLANYRTARSMLKELAPWMKVMDALSDIRFAREGLTDIPVPITSNTPTFVEEGFNPWTYYCCVPRGRYVNRHLDTPLAKIRMTGWLFYKTQVRGFLHWGYNYWYKSQTQQLIDPYTVTDGLAWPSWAYGDTFVVYPGENGPVDSLRWEVFAESLQDYALLQSAGISADDPILSEIKDYSEFPRTEDWITKTRGKILQKLNAKG